MDLEALKHAPAPYEVERFNEDFQKGEKYALWKKEMEEKYRKQKAKGGIIDRDAEDNRFLVVTEGNSSAEMTPSPVDEDRQPTAELEASAAKSCTIQSTNRSLEAAKPTSAQPTNRADGWPRRRGKWIQRPDAQEKERSNGAARRPSSNPPRRSKNESSHSRKELVCETDPVSIPAPSRPPPGFEPR